MKESRMGIIIVINLHPWGPASWYNRLSLCLHSQHPIWILILVLGVSILTQLLASAWEDSGGGLAFLGSGTYMGELEETLWLLASDQLSCDHWHLSLSVCPLCSSAFK